MFVLTAALTFAKGANCDRTLLLLRRFEQIVMLWVNQDKVLAILSLHPQKQTGLHPPELKNSFAPHGFPLISAKAGALSASPPHPAMSSFHVQISQQTLPFSNGQQVSTISNYNWITRHTPYESDALWSMLLSPPHVLKSYSWV